MQNRGSKEIHILPPRPQDNRHFLDSVFHTCSFRLYLRIILSSMAGRSMEKFHKVVDTPW